MFLCSSYTSVKSFNEEQDLVYRTLSLGVPTPPCPLPLKSWVSVGGEFLPLPSPELNMFLDMLHDRPSVPQP